MTIKFVPQDLWIGLYWKREIQSQYSDGSGRIEDVTYYLCVIPCFPIIWSRRTIILDAMWEEND